MVNTEVFIALGVCVAVTGVIYILQFKRKQQRKKEDEVAASEHVKDSDESKIEELDLPVNNDQVKADEEYQKPKDDHMKIEDLIKKEEQVEVKPKPVEPVVESKEEIKKPIVEVIKPIEMPESVPLIPLTPAVSVKPADEVPKAPVEEVTQDKEEIKPAVVVEEPPKEPEVVPVEEPEIVEEAPKEPEVVPVEEPKEEVKEEEPEIVDVPSKEPKVTPAEEPKREEEATPKEEPKVVEEDKDAGYGKIDLTIFYDVDRSRFSVKVHSATNLVNVDKKSLSDPYTRLTLEPDAKKETKRKTRVIKDSLNPEWEEEFEWTMTRSEVESKTLEVNLKDEKSVFQKQDSVFLGRLTIDLKKADIYTQPLRKSYWLQPEYRLTSLLKDTL